MEQDFQTSFIPKKPIINDRAMAPRPVGLLTIISFFIFFTMAIATGGLYFYKVVETKSIDKMGSDLNLAKNRFEPSKLTQLQVLDKRLKSATQVLASHVAITPIFTALQVITMKTVRYTKFSYALAGENPDPSVPAAGASSKIMVKMSGLAIGYRSVALQADLFAKNSMLIDPVFSNLSLDDKGNVLFDLNFSVDPNLVDYQNMLKAQSAESLQGAAAFPNNNQSLQPSLGVTN